jgi:hypothetical protein
MKNKIFAAIVITLSCFAISANAGEIPPIAEKELKLPPEMATESSKAEPIKASLPVTDAEESDAIKITSDKPEIVRLDRQAVNVIVGSHETLRIAPDTNQTLVLIPKKPGSTYFKALDVNGKIIMQRHVIVGVAKKDYVRIRRTCAAGDSNCVQFSVYYCPDMCHEVSVTEDATSPSPMLPTETVANAPLDETESNVEPTETLTPVIDETGAVSPSSVEQ